ncbi:hypothetical protein CK203_033534 [Vitis vinifera]|uniref:Uncharacterized protein n=1 Tax=Vitis vinifera TaxID=29760 RepID=A0A438FLD8_VITVI|nr:hypothetical protein CK203_033534 [Vitis vinifera]
MQETHALTPFLFPPSVGRVQSLRNKNFSESEFQKCSHRVFAEEIEMEAPISPYGCDRDNAETPRGLNKAKQRNQRGFNDESIGKFGEMMLEMLPQDLAFHDLRPFRKSFPTGFEATSESESGGRADERYLRRAFSLYLVSRPFPAAVFQNDALWKRNSSIGTDGYAEGEIVVHIMDGVIMDFEFEQSFQLDYSEEEEH